MAYFKTYPRCYTTRLITAKDNEYSKGDHELAVVYDLYINRKVDTDSWEFRKQVLAVALRLLANFKQWVNDQSVNANVMGYNLEFLKDTLNYIQTGNRRIGVLQWLELTTEVDQIASVNPNQKLSRVDYPGFLTTPHAIQKWCSWPNGFEDLLLTLNVLFGIARAPIYEEPAEHHPVGIID
jgi:hypothetical protein